MNRSISEQSSSDNNRIEEPWTHKGEELILEWCKDIKIYTIRLDIIIKQ